MFKEVNVIIAKLTAVLNALEGVEVKGRDNMDRLLGSIQTLEGVIRDLKTPPAEDKTEEVANGR